jgi:predicted O-methyltransferase YrrM
VENPNHYLRALQRKGKRLLNLDYAYRERLPVKAFKELFPEYDGAPISLARYEFHPAGVRMNELTYLCYLSGYFSDAQVFEFGTSVGRTTINLCLNVRGRGHVYSLDLPQNYQHESDQIPYAAIQQAEVQEFPRAQFISEHRSPLPITLLTGNSLEFDFSPFYGRMDLIFIDGGHSLEVVAKDSEHAFKLLKKDGGVIIWHDYWSFNCPEVVQSVNALTSKHRLFQIAGTRMAIYVRNGESVPLHQC